MFAQTCITVKPVLSGHSERKPKIAFQDLLTLNAGQIIAECSKGGGGVVGGGGGESILQYFRPSLTYHLPLRSLFWPLKTGFTVLFL